MKILLSDGSGLTSRQISTILARHNHEVHVFSPPGLTLTKLTSHVHKIHTVPPFGIDPYAWLSAALSIIRSEPEHSWDKKGFDLLICTQEQVAIVSAEREKFEATGIRLVVPEFKSLRKVMGKIEAVQTLRAAGLPQPESAVILSSAAVVGCMHLLPGYLKTSIGTASLGVQKVCTLHELQSAVSSFESRGLFSPGKKEKLLLQKEVSGSLLMICGVFDHGRLIAWHACVRLHEGPNGGAAKKVSLPLPVVGEDLAILGRYLDWHGALSLDAILSDGRPHYVDVNPRIVEPMNALLSGVNLVEALCDVSAGKEMLDSMVQVQEQGQEQRGKGRKANHGIEGVETHQLVLALLKKAEEGRFLVVLEAFKAAMCFERYAGSTEELTPVKGDWFELVVILAFVVFLTIGGKRAAEWMGSGAIEKYALGREGWREICEREDSKGRKVSYHE